MLCFVGLGGLLIVLFNFFYIDITFIGIPSRSVILLVNVRTSSLNWRGRVRAYRLGTMRGPRPLLIQPARHLGSYAELYLTVSVIL